MFLDHYTIYMITTHLVYWINLPLSDHYQQSSHSCMTDENLTVEIFTDFIQWTNVRMLCSMVLLNMFLL